MDRRDFQSSGIILVVARIFLCLLLLNQEMRLMRELDASAADPAELNAVNCISIAQFMSPKAIANVKTAKCCNALLWGISLTPDEVTGCIADKILVDDSQSTDLVENACHPKRSKRSLAFDFNYPTNVNKKWPLPINYAVSLNYANVALTNSTILAVMSYMQKETCVTFNPLNTTGSLEFVAGDGCLAYMGKSENPRTRIVLQSQCYFSFGEILNLMTSILGLADDSLRPDSSNYIFINESNLDSSNYPNFPLLAPTYITYNLPYDYASVLHAFPVKTTTTFNQITYRTQEPWYQNTIGQRSQLSFIDTKLINLIYCSDKCSGTTLNCEKGGYPDPNDCSKCKCPDGWDPSNRCITILPHDSQCGQQSYDLAVDRTFTIQSPGYNPTDGVYDPLQPLSCTWTITAPVGSHVTITFANRFGIYCHNLACYDWVEVRYNGSLNDTGPRFCCAKPLTQTIKSKDNQMMILFRSFGLADTSYAGFQINFAVDPCTVLWSAPVSNVHSFNGVEAPGPLSKDGCLATCEATPTCFGVDIDSSMIASTRYPKCFLHTNVSLAGGTSPAQGVDQYRVTDKCSLVTTTPPSTTAASTTPTTSATPTTPTIVSSISSAQTIVTTVSSPLTTVIVTGTQQSSTSILPSTISSIASTTTSTSTSTTTPATTTLSGIESCFQTLTGQQSSGAERVQSDGSVSDCLRICLSRSCAGVDFVPVTATQPSSECWLYNDPQKLQGKYANPAITQYINICNASIPMTTTTASTTSTSTAIPTTTSTTTPTTTTTSTAVPTTTSTTTATTAVSRLTFNLPTGVCPTTWTSRLGFQSSGATRNFAQSTESDCVSYCLQTLSCVGVDVVLTTVPQECWVYSDVNQLGNKYSNPSVIQYEFTRNCATSTPTVPGCQNQWVIYNSSHSVGATKTSNPMLLDDCLNRCATDPLCVAVDFNSASNPVECWVHTNIANINVRYADPSIKQYVISSRCPTSPAPPNPGCGGGSINPGEFCPPCSIPVYPPRTCQKQVITFVFQGGCWTQRLDYVNTPCVTMTCYGNAQLVTICGIQQCVVTGWSDWGPCSASCGSFGTQRRYRYTLVSNQYVTVEQDERVCNTQVCPCSARSCSRCCSGYYESNGFCYRWG